MARKKATTVTSVLSTAGLISQETQRFGEAAHQLALDSSVTIGYRLPQFFEAALGFPEAQEEVRHAVIEKMTATMEAHMATGFAMMQFGWSMAPGGSSRDMVKSAADIAHAALAPMTRRAKANASRLTAKGRG